MINAVFLVAGNVAAPATYGLSTVVSNQLRIGVTLTGEAAAFGVLGAQPRKIFTHTAVRAVQMEATRSMPFVGDIINYGEMGMQYVGNVDIGLSYVADLVMKEASSRYTSLLTPRDLGDSRVLYELDQRIDYLSRFLIPYGQWLLINEQVGSRQRRLRRRLKKQGKVLRKLEKKRTQAICFYQLALLGGRVPENRRDKVFADTLAASTRTHKNCHRIARQCLATLINS
jgi:hypothetical protein